MHQNSYDIMGYFVNKYLNSKVTTRILDVGSYDQNGSYRNHFFYPKWIYEGCDISMGPNVDFTMGEYSIDKKSGYYDVVISGQTMEHVEYFWEWIKPLRRVLKPGGLLILIAPGSGQIHRAPLDCWRFHPDGMRALAKWADLEVLECFMDQNTEWWDCTLIAKK